MLHDFLNKSAVREGLQHVSTEDESGLDRMNDEIGSEQRPGDESPSVDFQRLPRLSKLVTKEESG